MKILIEISKEDYESIKYNTNKTGSDYLILNGRILPAGHGRLIDADELKKHKYHDNDRSEKAIAVAQIDWADTVIEADKEVE